MTSFELQHSSCSGDQIEQVKKHSDTKVDIDCVESAGADQAASYGESVAARLPKAHQDYLLQRHGTLELDPIPGMCPDDPYNWPEWKVSNDSRLTDCEDEVLMFDIVENDQSYPRGIPCLYGYFHCRSYYPCLFRYRRGIRCWLAKR